MALRGLLGRSVLAPLSRAVHTSAEKHLVRNDFNKVEVIRCASPAHWEVGNRNVNYVQCSFRPLVKNAFGKTRTHAKHARMRDKDARDRLGSLPHVCVAGVSNSGKSSLINHLLKKDNIAVRSPLQ